MDHLKVVDALPRPRVGVAGNWTAEELRELEGLFPRVWHGADTFALTRSIGTHELDIIICADVSAEFVGRVADLILLGDFGRVQFESGVLSDGKGWPYRRTSESHGLYRSTAAPFGAAIDALVEHAGSPFGLPVLARPEDWDDACVLIADGDKQWIAINRRGPGRRVGAVCAPLPNRILWVRAFLADWAPLDRERYQGLAVWNESREWRSPEENRLADAIADADARLAAAQAEHRARMTHLTAALARAQDEEHRGARRLLTAKGEELEAAVAACLRDLGFQVTQVDVETKAGQRRQDLNLVDPTLPDWIAIVEVKGKGKGSLSGDDLAQLQKHLRRFEQTHRREPSMGIIVMNSGADSPPAQRPVPFASDLHGLEEFAAEDNLVIPTTVLYKLHRWVREGGDAARARTLIREGRGRLDEAHLATL